MYACGGELRLLGVHLAGCPLGLESALLLRAGFLSCCLLDQVACPILPGVAWRCLHLSDMRVPARQVSAAALCAPSHACSSLRALPHRCRRCCWASTPVLCRHACSSRQRTLRSAVLHTILLCTGQQLQPACVPACVSAAHLVSMCGLPCRAPSSLPPSEPSLGMTQPPHNPIRA